MLLLTTTLRAIEAPAEATKQVEDHHLIVVVQIAFVPEGKDCFRFHDVAQLFVFVFDISFTLSSFPHLIEYRVLPCGIKGHAFKVLILLIVYSVLITALKFVAPCLCEVGTF